MALDLPPWSTLLIFKGLSQQLKEDYPLPDYVTRIAAGTSSYEEVIRELWERFKQEPTLANARKFIADLIKYSATYWLDYLADVLNINPDNLSDAQIEHLKNALEEHHGFLQNSLLPDLIKAIGDGIANFSNMDYRVIFLYAGAIWSFGFLSTILFDGLQPRDAGDIFLFLGPNDENTCEGERGCKQYVGKAYTVAEIVMDDIIPGHLRCRTSCRHILIPVVST